MTDWLILDVNYLAHRAFHSTGKIGESGPTDGTLYGVLRDILSLQNDFNTNDIVFCFDSGNNKRNELLPDYKAGRVDPNATPEQIENKRLFYIQVDKLRDYYLPKLGYSNVFHCPGFEGDDIIASLVRNTIPRMQKVTIVTSDGDMFQLLTENVVCWNPTLKVCTTRESFIQQWDVSPDMWPIVKALAGCSTDNVPGLQGVGEITAARFLAGTLNPGKKKTLIVNYYAETTTRNLPLVRLPFAGCPTYKLSSEENVSKQKWESLLKYLGFTDLIGLL